MRLRTRHRVAIATTLAYGAVLALVAFWPEPVDRPIDRPLDDVLSWFERAGLGWVSYGLVEALANIALFVPFGVLLTLWLGPRRWWLAVLAGILTSTVIELVQLVLLPHRFASLRDVLMNGAGVAIGAAVTAAVSSAHAAGRRRRATGRPAASPSS